MLNPTKSIFFHVWAATWGIRILLGNIVTPMRHSQKRRKLEDSFEMMHLVRLYERYIIPSDEAHTFRRMLSARTRIPPSSSP